MKVIGLTGGIGMGKSTSARFLVNVGIPAVDTDQIARQLVEPGQPSLEEIIKEFGESVLGVDGKLKRAELANVVFKNAEARQKLEAILHPRIRDQWLLQIDAWRKENVALAVVVIPLLFETQAESYFDKIICVACSASNQWKRLEERGWVAQQIRLRISAQMPVDQKIARSNFVVWTDGTLESHKEQIDRVIQKI